MIHEVFYIYIDTITIKQGVFKTKLFAFTSNKIQIYDTINKHGQISTTEKQKAFDSKLKSEHCWSIMPKVLFIIV